MGSNWVWADLGKLWLRNGQWSLPRLNQRERSGDEFGEDSPNYSPIDWPKCNSNWGQLIEGLGCWLAMKGICGLNGDDEKWIGIGKMRQRNLPVDSRLSGKIEGGNDKGKNDKKGKDL